MIFCKHISLSFFKNAGISVILVEDYFGFSFFFLTEPIESVYFTSLFSDTNFFGRSLLVPSNLSKKYCFCVLTRIASRFFLFRTTLKILYNNNSPTFVSFNFVFSFAELDFSQKHPLLFEQFCPSLALSNQIYESYRLLPNVIHSFSYFLSHSHQSLANPGSK